MRVVVAAVGKVRDANFAVAIEEYETRAKRYWPLSTVEVKEESRGSADAVRAAECKRLLAAIPKGAQLVACDLTGKQYASDEFAKWLQARREAAHDVAFLIGGAFGLTDEVRTKASLLLSLGRMTLPHEMARLVLMEQLYRAGTIARGEPYHK
jgi:23S rRNA (pseudouridine1915-N3)-methyltransferase